MSGAARGSRGQAQLVLALGMLVVGVLAAVLVVFAASHVSTGPVANPSPAPTNPTPPVATVDVQGAQSWTDTGLDVLPGEQLLIQATGMIHHNLSAPPVGPDGAVGQPDLDKFSVITTIPHAALIGKVGEGGDPFPIGARSAITIKGTGRLMLGPNDRGVDNNDGHFTATITILKT